MHGAKEMYFQTWMYTAAMNLFVYYASTLDAAIKLS